MYGVSQGAMERIEKRLKEKIYREMIEQQQKYKRAIEEEKRKDRYEPHIRTEPSHEIQSYPTRRNAKGFPSLDYESTFLPAIKNSRRQKDYDENQSRLDEQQPYPAYRSNDNLSFARKESKKKSTFDTIGEEDDTLDIRNTKQQDPEDSDEEKAQLYLEQCEQIIGSLKELTNKNGRKVRPKANKYDPNEPMKKLLVSSSKNTRKPSYKQMNNNQSFRINASTPIYRDHGYAKTPNLDYDKSQLIPIKAFWSSNFNKNQEKQSPFSPNEFDEAQAEKPKTKKQKVRENNINISPPKGQEQENPENEEEEEEQEEEPIPPPRPKKAANDPKKKEKEKQKQKEKDKQRQKDKGGDKTKDKAKSKAENKNQQPQNAEDDPQKQQKRQQAIVKYLKKARVRGNLLYQKIQQRKKQSKDAQGGDPPADNPPPEPKQ